jgi:hypothetical protein
MVRTIALLVALSCPAALLAAPADIGSLSAEAALGAGPNQVFPPLPPSATLPAVAMADGASAAGTSAGPARKARRVAAKKVIEPPVRLVVTDASHAYLATIERQLDDVMNKGDSAPRVATIGDATPAGR